MGRKHFWRLDHWIGELGGGFAWDFDFEEEAKRALGRRGVLLRAMKPRTVMPRPKNVSIAMDAEIYFMLEKEILRI